MNDEIENFIHSELVTIYNEYLTKNNLPEYSADEVLCELYEEGYEDQRDLHEDWIVEFIDVWNLQDELDDSENVETIFLWIRDNGGEVSNYV